MMPRVSASARKLGLAHRVPVLLQQVGHDVDLRVVGRLVGRVGRHRLADLVEERRDAAVVPMRQKIVALERRAAVARQVELVAPAAASRQEVLLAAFGLRLGEDAVERRLPRDLDLVERAQVGLQLGVARRHAVDRHDVREDVRLDFVAQERRPILRHRVANEHEQAGEVLVVVLRPEHVALERRSALRAGQLDVVASRAGALERFLAASRLGARVHAVPDLLVAGRAAARRACAAAAETISSPTATAAPNHGVLRRHLSVLATALSRAR